jgi:hypothetical protein
VLVKSNVARVSIFWLQNGTFLGEAYYISVENNIITVNTVDSVEIIILIVFLIIRNAL